MSTDDHVTSQIRQGNLWYVQEQLPTLNHPGVARVVNQRWRFIHSVLNSLDPRQSPLRVLDAGCGDGVNLSFLTKVAGLEVHGMDYNPLRVERAATAFPEARIFQSDLTDLSDIEERYDCILLSQVMEHIKDDQRILHQLGTLLAPGGRLIVGVPNEGCWLAWLRNHVLFPKYARTTDHVHFYTLPALRRLFAHADLTVERIMTEGFFYPSLRMHQFFCAGELRYRFSQFLGRALPRLSGGFYFCLSRPSKEGPPTTSLPRPCDTPPARG
ncbi:MAG: class I SAM-dependent methyltransferase [Pseudomonadota bacterium]